MNQTEEDYEISNKQVSEYLHSLGYEDDLNEIRNFQQPYKTNDQKIETTRLNQNFSISLNPIAYLFDSDFIVQLMQTNGQKLSEIILESDYQIIIKENLIFFSYKSDSNVSNYFHHHKKYCGSIFILILALAAVNIQIFAIFLIFFVILISLRYKLISKYFQIWLSVSARYSQISRQLVVFIKQGHLVELSLQKRHFSNQNQLDINFIFRKKFFLELRKNFYQLKKINLEILNKIEKNHDNFVCALNDNDLSPVMRLNGQELDQFTDKYSFNCVNSILKLNLILISENFKLILLNFFDFLKNGTNFFNFCFMAVNCALQIEKFVNELKKLDKINKSIDQDEVPKSKERINPLENEDYLSLYLRSCLLNSQRLRDLDNQSKIETLKLIRTGLECCNLYIEKIESTCGVLIPQEEISNITSEKSESKIKILDKENVTEFDQELNFEDEIFEAEDNFVFDQKEEMKNSEPEELSLKEKQELLNTKNLFYELKFALKSKTNEWKEREKRAKYNTNRNNDILFTLENREDRYLLDNDLMVYKSKLRKKNLTKTEFKQSIEKKTKYAYETNTESFCPRIHGSILSEIVGNKLFLQSDVNEEIFAD